MKINQQELEEAIETISDGGTALGVSCEGVYEVMARIDSIRNAVFEGVHGGQITCDIAEMFEDEFACVCREMLIGKLRAKMENENGL